MGTPAEPSSVSDCENILPSTVGLPEEKSLRHIIRTRFPNGMPEDSIAIIMREILKALNFLHVSLGTGHTDVDSSNICVNTDEVLTTIKLVFHPGKQSVHPGPAWSQGRTPTDGIWGLGITALEMGYGSLPGNGKAQLVSLANNVIRILKLKLDYPDEKGKEKAKNKGKEKLESADDQKLKEKAIQIGKGKLGVDDDQEMKEKAMQKGKEKLELDDDQEMKEKAMQKGKEKLELAEDPKGKEMAKQKGKEKLGVADDQKGKEMAKKKGKVVKKKLTIKLPVLEKLLDIRYVEHLEEKLIEEKEEQEKKKKAVAALTEKFKKVMKFFRKNKNDNADERKFSRDFLEVVLMCLDEQNLTTAENILAQPFFQQPINVQKFERSMRMGSVV